MPDREKHKGLETWQVAVGIAGVLVSLFLLFKHGESQQSAEPVRPLPTAYGPVEGGGGGGGSSVGTSQEVRAPERTGQQSPPAPPNPKEAAPGESQHEFEQGHQHRHPGGPPNNPPPGFHPYVGPLGKEHKAYA